MEKIKLSDGTVLEFVEISDYNDTLSIKFTGLEINYLKNIFSNKENLTTIEVLTEGDALCRIFEGYNSVSTKTKYEIEDDFVTVTIYKPGDLEIRVNGLEEQNKELTEAVELLVLTQLESEV